MVTKSIDVEYIEAGKIPEQVRELITYGELNHWFAISSFARIHHFLRLARLQRLKKNAGREFAIDKSEILGLAISSAYHKNHMDIAR